MKVYDGLRIEGKQWNHKRVTVCTRPWTAFEKKSKRLPARVKEPLEVPGELNHTWRMYFVTDALENKRRFRSFNVIDDLIGRHFK